MALLGRLRALLVLAAVAVSLGLAGPAAADELQDCIDAGQAQGIDMPSCVVNDDGSMTPYDDSSGFGGGDPGIPGEFVLVMVLALVVGIAITIWKVTAARRLATQSGMDPDIATGITLLDQDGLSAAYLASSVRATQPPAATAPGPGPEAAETRLLELKRLLDAGLITQAEHDEQRRAIIGSV